MRGRTGERAGRAVTARALGVAVLLAAAAGLAGGAGAAPAAAPASLADLPVALLQAGPGDGAGPFRVEGPGALPHHLVPPGVLRPTPLLFPSSPLPGLPDPPAIRARAAILVEWRTGTVLYARRADVRVHPASTTKILTAILALERGSLDDVVTVSARSARTPGSSMGLTVGMRVPLEDLVYGLLVTSGNDAAVAIAEHLAGSVEEFSRLMNRRAWELGALASTFRNPHGLTARGHKTTARDLATLAGHALELPRFREMACTGATDVCSADGTWERVLFNTNRLLGTGQVEGIKTGTTGAAGDCLVASAMRDGLRLVSVVLDAGDRWADTLALLEWGYRAVSFVPLLQAGEYVGSVAAVGGVTPRVAGLADGPLVAPVPWAQDAPVRVELSLEDPVRAPVRQGQPLGLVRAVAGDTVLATAWVVAATDVDRERWWRRILGRAAIR